MSTSASSPEPALVSSQPRLGNRASACTLRVEVVFRDLDSEQSHAVAADLIARAHELANRPESQCDVDVSVDSPAGGDDRAGAPRAL